MGATVLLLHGMQLTENLKYPSAKKDLKKGKKKKARKKHTNGHTYTHEHTYTCAYALTRAE